MNKQVVISIDDESGELSFVHDESIAEMINEVGSVEKTRATLIYPVNRLARWLFTFVRSRVSDDSVAAAITRIMPVMWEAKVVSSGFVIGRDRSRKRLIQTEIEYLETNVL